MKITMKKSDFIEDENGRPVDFPPTELTLPRQIADQREAAQVEKAAQVADISVKVFMASNVAMTVFLTAILVFVWGMINGMQVISLTCLFEVRLPPNIFSVNLQILKLA